MIGILLITHGPFGNSLIKSSSLILGVSHNIDALGIYHGDNIDEFEIKISNKIKEMLKISPELLIFTDLIGGSPSNAVAITLAKYSKENIECIVGINLPMLLTALCSRENKKLSNIVSDCIKTGEESIFSLRDRLKI